MLSPSEALRRAADELRPQVQGEVLIGEPIARFTSFRVGGPAGLFVEPASEVELANTGKVVAKFGLKTLVIGRGTNLLVSDSGFEGVVIRLGRFFEWIREEPAPAGVEDEKTQLSAGAATPLPQVANRAAKLSLTGLEFAIAIPAAVGGAVRMNAGAHSSSMSDVLVSAHICRLLEGLIEEVRAGDLGLAYRQSDLGDLDVVCSAQFKLEPAPRDEVRRKMDKYRAHRTETQPVEAPNAGSMFRNPPGDTAGRLVESAGLKGFKAGHAEVSSKHANFFLAHSGASAQEVFDLMAAVQARVEKQFGVLLKPEVRTVGTFERAETLREVDRC